MWQSVCVSAAELSNMWRDSLLVAGVLLFTACVAEDTLQAVSVVSCTYGFFHVS